MKHFIIGVTRNQNWIEFRVGLANKNHCVVLGMPRVPQPWFELAKPSPQVQSRPTIRHRSHINTAPAAAAVAAADKMTQKAERECKTHQIGNMS